MGPDPKLQLSGLVKLPLFGVVQVDWAAAGEARAATSRAAATNGPNDRPWARVMVRSLQAARADQDGGSVAGTRTDAGPIMAVRYGGWSRPAVHEPIIVA